MRGGSLLGGLYLAAGVSGVVQHGDSAPPVVSLRLADADASEIGTHFVRQCAVYKREATTSGPTDACEDPTCEAIDHHEGRLKCDMTARLINNNGTVTDVKEVVDGTADRKMRSEWLYRYNAKDSNGNAAEEVTFTLVVYDHVKPQVIKPFDFGLAHISRKDDLRAEACNMHNTTAPYSQPFGKDPCTWHVPMAMATDNVDTVATMSNRIYVQAIAPDANGIASRIPSDNSADLLKEGQFGVLQQNRAAEIDTQKLGVWRVRWEACDTAQIFGEGGSNNCAFAETAVDVVDTQKPIIEVVADNTASSRLECGRDRYVESGARCKDLRDSWVDGAWHFDSRDADGNWQLSDDNRAIQVRTTTDVELRPLNKTNPDPAGVLVKKEGVFNVAYDCNDAANNEAVTARRQVHVHDSQKPRVKITSGVDMIQVSAGDTTQVGRRHPYQDGNAQIVWELVRDATTCYDDCSPTETVATLHYGPCKDQGDTVGDGTLSASNWDKHAERKPGYYSVQYLCHDQAHNGPFSASTCLTIDNVDKTKPTLTLLGNSTVDVEVSLTGGYDDEGAMCFDQVEGDISSQVTVSGDVVNLAKVGRYVMRYECTDTAGNEADTLPRTINVRHSKCPTCKIEGPSFLDHEAGFAFTDEGVACSDYLDSACVVEGIPDGHTCVIEPVVVTREGDDSYKSDVVDVYTVGTYMMTYRAVNSVGRSNDDPSCKPHPVSYVRTVEIKDTLAPVIRIAYNGKPVAYGKGDEVSKTTGQTAGVKNPFHAGQHTPEEGWVHWDARTLMAEQSQLASSRRWLIGAAAAGAAGIALLALSSRRDATLPPV